MKDTPDKLSLGEVVPYLSLPSSKGDINLWNFKQKKNLVIFFYHGTYCVHCVSRLKELAEAYPKFKELDTEILAVSFDNPEKLEAYAKRIRIPFPFLSDRTGETTERFTYKDAENKVPLPSIFITDRFGVLRYQEIAFEAHELTDVNDILSWLLL